MRWRFQGLNWEGRQFTVTPAIRKLAEQLDAMNGMPHRNDGTVASRTHDANSPRSDHRPYPYDAFQGARVRAIDVGDVDTARLTRITEALRQNKDRRLQYVIFDRRYFSPKTLYQWRTYTGANPHEDHIHVSVNHYGDSDGSPWNLTTTNPPEEDEVIKLGDRGPHVKFYQELLIELNALEPPAAGAADGIFGPKTEEAVKKIQAFPKVGLPTSGEIDTTTASAIIERLSNLRAERHAKTPHGAGDHEHLHRHSFEFTTQAETDAAYEA